MKLTLSYLVAAEQKNQPQGGIASYTPLLKQLERFTSLK
jgi:hypothetical protein